MKRSEAVFFFTLVDFLLQIAFFSLVLYAVVQVQDAKRAKTEVDGAKAAQVVTRWTGFSTLTELSDFLSKLAPPIDFRGWADFMSRLRDPKQAEVWKGLRERLKDPKAAKDWHDVIANTDDPDLPRRFAAAAAEAGGADKLMAMLRQYGSPPCLIPEQRGQKEPYAVASIVLQDDAVVIVRRTSAFDLLAERLGPGDKNRYSLAEFRARFSALREGRLHPEYRDCRLFVEAREETDLKFARDALSSAFRWKR